VAALGPRWLAGPFERLAIGGALCWPAVGIVFAIIGAIASAPGSRSSKSLR